MRFAEGTIELRPDTEWATAMHGGQRAVVTGLTAPLLAHIRVPPVKGEGPGFLEAGRILRMVRMHRRDPMPYSRAVADLVPRYLRARGLRIGGRWLDVGSGQGAMPVALEAAGAASAVGLDVADRRVDGARSSAFVLGSGEQLPFAAGSFDGVISSNVLEHTLDTWGMVRELLRVTRPGGVVFLSWTNWYSPLGGHEWSPLHYLGPRLGPRVYRWLFGRPPPWNIPGRTLFRVDVGPVLRGLERMDVDVLDVAPRYWPRLRLLARIPCSGSSPCGTAWCCCGFRITGNETLEPGANGAARGERATAVEPEP
jgi:SAM-dependent methyltransferase